MKPEPCAPQARHRGVAACVALATGIGISLPAAACLRAMLVVLCVASLVFITARRLRSLIARRVSQQ